MNIISSPRYFNFKYRFCDEIFSAIYKHQSYMVSNYGRVANKESLIISPWYLKDRFGNPTYQCVTISKTNYLVHRLVALHHVINDDYELNDCVNHLDCDKNNNFYKNLSWTTQNENVEHARISGRMGTMLLVSGNLSTPRQMSDWINGFN